MSGSTVMAWLVIVGSVLVSRLRVSMPLLTCWRWAWRGRRPRGCWRAGSGSRRAGMPVCRPGEGVGAGGGARVERGVHRQAARGAGRAGAGACARERDHDLRRGHARADRVSGARPQEQFPQVNDRAVETEFVFGRHAATELSVAYAVLAPQRQARIARAGEEGRPPRDERGDLRPGLQCPAEEGRDDRVADRGAARARRAGPA